MGGIKAFFSSPSSHATSMSPKNLQASSDIPDDLPARRAHRSFLRSRGTSLSPTSSKDTSLQNEDDTKDISLASKVSHGSQMASSSSTDSAQKPKATEFDVLSSVLTQQSTPDLNHRPKLGSPHKKTASSLDSHHSHKLRRFLKKFGHHDKDEGKAEPLPKSDSDLLRKFGTLGKFLGAGASGLVNIVTRREDPTTLLAIKKFRSRQPQESESTFKGRVQNEFEIGECLKHPNLIHVFELFKDYPNTSIKRFAEPSYYMVMEYCRYDFFNLVMLGLMGQHETECYFNQMSWGVQFLHENGFAHRDLKLENCVVNESGVLKIIDYGLAVCFRKPINPEVPINEKVDVFIDDEHKLVWARGIVGSDPYLAPEVFEPSNFGYDPRLTDVWLLAIIYCCMILRRFPWQLAKSLDNSYVAFAKAQGHFHDTNKENSGNVESSTELPVKKAGGAASQDTPNQALALVMPSESPSNETTLTADSHISEKDLSDELSPESMPTKEKLSANSDVSDGSAKESDATKDTFRESSVINKSSEESDATKKLSEETLHLTIKPHDADLVPNMSPQKPPSVAALDDRRNVKSSKESFLTPKIQGREKHDPSNSLQVDATSVPSHGKRSQGMKSHADRQWLLQLLPPDSRSLIGHMLAIDPQKRYMIKDVVESDYLRKSPVCKSVREAFKSDSRDLDPLQAQDSPDNHTHHLVTEEELNRIMKEKEMQKKLKKAGVV